MDPLVSTRPLLAILVSLSVVPLIVFSKSRPNLRETWTFLAAGSKFLIVLSMLPHVLQGGQYIYTLAEVLPGLPIQLRVDAMGMLFALVSSSLWIVTSAYSIGYMRGLNEHSQTRYFCFFAIALSSTIGVAFSANLFTMYLFYEMLSLATYPLVTHHQDSEAKISGRKYLTYILGTSIGLVLPAMLYVYHVSGDLTFSSLGLLAGKAPPHVISILLVMFVFGFAKAAVMPFHAWLPAAMVAPTPVSALLHAVAVVKVGVFSILRVITGIFGVELLCSGQIAVFISYVAAFTILMGSLVALSQDELKRRLAFSTISQLSYIVLGATLLSPKGLSGSLLHIAMHAFGKITLFFCAGAIYVATGKKYISQMGGIGRRMPITMLAFLIGAMSVIGLPPCGGFISKWFLLFGTLEAHQSILLIVFLFSSFLNAAYFLPIVYRAFFYPENHQGTDTKFQEAPIWCVVPLVITAILCIVLFFHQGPFVTLAQLTFKP